ncbi:MAG: DUF1272 domain-containing protein [Acidobacteriota bacterium]
MLELRPNCETCDADLPPDSIKARICTYECTFCSDCVDGFLRNVCPNCGGGLECRPIRPRVARRPGVSLEHQPASQKRVHTKHSREELDAFAASAADIDPRDR